MSIIKKIFNIDYDSSSYIKLADSVFPDLPGSIVRNIKCRNNKLVEICDRYENTKDYTPSQADIKNIKLKFNKYKKNLEKQSSCVVFSQKELKKISFYVSSVVDSSNDLLLLKRLLEENWNDSYLSGLLYYLMYNWEIIADNPENNRFKEFIISKLKKYSGSRKKILALKTKYEFLNKTGPVQFAMFLMENNIPIMDSLSLLGLKKQSISYSYFCKTIRTYFYKKGFPEELQACLDKHNNSDTCKIIVSQAIISIENGQFVEDKHRVQSYAIKNIGDPSIAANWSLNIDDDNLESIVKKAGAILSHWMIEMYVDLIFNEVFQDPSREAFWIRYAKANRIDYLKVIGGHLNKSKLLTHNVLKDSIDIYFKETVSDYNRNTCAILMRMGQYNFIEFSDQGALYVYKNGEFINRILTSNINKIDDLKDASLNNLVSREYNYYYYEDEGRMVHIGNWTTRLDNWIYEKI